MSSDRERSRVRATVLVGLAAMLLLLPLVVTVDDLFAVLGARLGVDRVVGGLTPIEASLAAALLQLLGVDAAATGSRLVTSAGGLHQTVQVTWNCSGWQAFLLLGASLGVGLRRQQRLAGRIEVVCIGVIGTLLCNVLRISVVAWIAARFGYVPALLFHDYGGVLLGVAWLFVFWEVAYRWVLSDEPSAITMSVSA